MEKGTFKVVLADGTFAENLTMNGNNFISKTKLTEEFFTGKMNTITVEGPEGTRTLNGAKLVQLCKVGPEWWFILEEKTTEEKIREKLEAAMATNAEDITNVQLALADVYEMVMNGGVANA